MLGEYYLKICFLLEKAIFSIVENIAIDYRKYPFR